MYTGGAARKPVRKAPAKKGGAVASKGLFSGGRAPAKGKTKLAVSSAPAKRTYIDVTGNEYQEVSSFTPQFDEVGVLPPLGRWDPLKIREQVTIAAQRAREAAAVLLLAASLLRGCCHRRAALGREASLRLHAF